MEFDYFYNTWIREHSLTNIKKLYGLGVYLDKDGKIEGILWFDRCSGGFNCPYQRISLDVKHLHEVKEFGKLVVKIYPYKPNSEASDNASSNSRHPPDKDESAFERLKSDGFPTHHEQLKNKLCELYF